MGTKISFRRGEESIFGEKSFTPRICYRFNAPEPWFVFNWLGRVFSWTGTYAPEKMVWPLKYTGSKVEDGVIKQTAVCFVRKDGPTIRIECVKY
ncbi:MAG: hypothetical protein V3U75_13460 [Methylococcaceae bacterium]